jgi:ribosome modulation factor
MSEAEDWLNSLGERKKLDPLEEARRKGYTEGYLAAQAEVRGDAKYLAELTETPLSDLMKRYASLDADEATRVWHEMHYRMKLVPEGSTLLALYDRLNRELQKGERCAVCGRANGNDCATEC